MDFVKALLVLSLAAIIGGLAFVYSGLFNPAADEPHSMPFHWLLETVRERGIGARADGAAVPDLKEAALVRAGAGNYHAMCVGCHLAPGMPDSEIHRGLYPQPPVLAVAGAAVEPRRAFWVIKHGIKASGMPAWGKSMDDRAIWGMVAFLQALPKLTPEQYHEAVEASGGHSHAVAHDEPVMGAGPEQGAHEHHHSGDVHPGPAHEGH